MITTSIEEGKKVVRWFPAGTAAERPEESKSPEKIRDLVEAVKDRSLYDLAHENRPSSDLTPTKK